MDGDLTHNENYGWCRNTWLSIQRYWVNDGIKMIFILIYILANVALFMERFYYYYWGDGRPVFELFGHGVTFARGAAAALKLNCAFILVPVLRNFLAWIRGTWVNNLLPIDKAITFHKYIGVLILFWTIMHIMAHGFNWYTWAHAPLAQLNAVLDDNLTKNPNVYRTAFLTVAGYTGLIALFSMVLMYSSAIESMRRPYFEAFWYTHHLFIAFYAALVCHGLAGVLEKATFWYWLIGPATIYIIERAIRIYRGTQTVKLVQAIQHPSRVIELRMQKQGFRFRPGQWLFLNMPYLAPHEWHPFTISSAPQDEYVSCHIRVVGDWTGKLSRELNPEKKPSGVVQENLLYAQNGSPILRIDGPFGAASEDVFDFENVVLIAAGVGVTPFASILKTLRHAMDGGTLTLRKVYFFWIARDRTCFEWFQDVLSSIEQADQSSIFNFNIYFTGQIKDDEVRAVMQQNPEAPDLISGLRARTNFARPKWDGIFADLKNRHHGQKVGVFYCGPSTLSKTLYKYCRRYTDGEKGGTKFKFKKENF